VVLTNNLISDANAFVIKHTHSYHSIQKTLTLKEFIASMGVEGPGDQEPAAVVRSRDSGFGIEDDPNTEGVARVGRSVTSSGGGDSAVGDALPAVAVATVECRAAL